LLDAYQLCRHLGWTWRDYQETPVLIRQLFKLYATWESNAAEARQN
jgi:hypothetical protein